MRYCRKRGSPNLNGVATSKRPLFRMGAVITAACLALRERAAFVTSWGSSERILFCSIVFLLL